VRPHIGRPRQTIIDAAVEAVEVAEPLEAVDDAEAADDDGAWVVAAVCTCEQDVCVPRRADIPCADARWPQ
jgi:hypothetical protein